MATIDALVKVVEGLCVAHDTLTKRVALLEKVVRRVHDDCSNCPGGALGADDEIIYDDGSGLTMG